MNYDLTVGNVRKTLWRYTIPMFISVIFQQLYTLADSAIAGKYAGDAALSAIGTSYPITMIFMAIATGTNIGVTVVISQFFGAKLYDKVKTATYTTFIFGAGLSAVITIAAILCSPLMLQAISTPAEIFADAKLYLNIYLAGFAFLFFYNVTNGIFNALGDSKTPLYLLIMSSVGNIFLDILFVAVFHMGVAGAGWATFLMQGIACILAAVLLFKRLKHMECVEKPKIYSWRMLGTVSFISIPSIIQSSFISVGNFFIQRLINLCGPAVIAGFSAAFKLNMFSVTTITTISGGVSAFVAQNIGAEKYDRVKKGVNSGLLLSFIVVIPFVIVYTFFGKYPVWLFLEDPGTDAMRVAVEYLQIVAPFQICLMFKLVCDGALRGAKAMKLFTIATFMDLILRVVISYVLFPHFAEKGIWYSWPIGWIIGTIFSLIFYYSGMWKKNLKKVE